MDGFGSLEPRWLISCAVIKRMPFQLKVFVLFVRENCKFLFSTGHTFDTSRCIYANWGAHNNWRRSKKPAKRWKTRTIEENVCRQIKNATCAPCTRSLYALHIDTFHSKRWTKSEREKERCGMSKWERERNEWEQRQELTKKPYIHHTQTPHTRHTCTRFKKH